VPVRSGSSFPSTLANQLMVVVALMMSSNGAGPSMRVAVVLRGSVPSVVR
jgi:hypothetical protein